jgi:adenylate cyclase
MRSQLQQLLWDSRGVWIAAPLVAVLVIGLRFAGLLQSWEWEAFDLYLRLPPTERPDRRIAIVGIDETDYKRVQQGYIADAVYAEALQKLKAMQPRAIGLDIYRDLPYEPGHQALVDIFASTPNLVGIRKVVGDRDRDAVAPPPMLAEKGQVGANDLIIDADGKVRRGFMYLSEAEGNTVYSFALYLALLYLDAEGIGPEVLEDGNWKLGPTEFRPLEANDGGYIRTDSGGYQQLIDYRGPVGHFESVPLRDLLDDRLPPDWARDRIVLIGVVSESANDLFWVPHSGGLLSLPERMAGVEIHANLTSQILSAALDDRPPIRSWPEAIEWLWILLWCALGATLTWQLRYAGGVRSVSLQRAAAGLFAVALLFGTTYIAFIYKWWIPLVPPALGFAGSAIAITAYIARTAGDIRKTFGRYLTDEVVANLLESPEGLKLGGERRQITIFTSDLRGFTALSERLPPEEVVKILNFYLGYMADVITCYQGTIDEFMGDGILVLFGAPTARPDDAERAVACAVAMQLAMRQVNLQMEQWDLPALEMGIGINTGDVVVGNIGSEKRTKYGVVGSQVNLTYRIESYTTGGQILISETTLNQAGAIVKIDSQREVMPKGVKEPITIYEVGGISGKYNLFLSKEEERFFPLPNAIPLQYIILDGKHVGTTFFKGKIVNLSNQGAAIARADSQQPMPTALTNLKLNLIDYQESELSEDIYGKVTDKTDSSGNFYIRFTAKPPEVAIRLQTLYESIKGG